MKDTPFQSTLRDITQILQAIDEISVQADSLARCKALEAVRSQTPAEGRRTLEAIADNLDRIIAKAQEVELLVSIVPDAALTESLQAPSAQLRDAVTSLVVCAYGAAESIAEESPAFPAAPLWFHAA